MVSLHLVTLPLQKGFVHEILYEKKINLKASLIAFLSLTKNLRFKISPTHTWFSDLIIHYLGDAKKYLAR